MIYLLVAAELLVWANYSRRHVPMLGVCCLVFTQGGVYDPVIPWAVVIEEGGALRVAMRYSDDGQRVTTAPRPGEGVRAELFCVPAERSVGLLGPVFVRRNHTISLMNNGAPFSAAEYAFVRTTFAEALRQDWGRGVPPEYFSMLAAGDGTYKQMRIDWLAHDVSVLTLLVLALNSTAIGWQAARDRQRREKHAAIVARGLCPHCKYPIADVMSAGHRTCPECGERLEPASAAQEGPTE